MTPTGLTAVAGFCAFLLALALAAVLRRLARRYGFVAQPRADRWHLQPTALLGGVALALGFSIPVLACAPIREAGPIVGLGLLIAGLGLIDDVRRVNPGAKLAFETVVAAAALGLGYRLGWTGSITVDSLLTLVWLVGLANAFNLLDNMDGLAAGVAAIGSTAYLVLALTHGTAADGVMFASLVGATLGFLVLNFHPASMFMGDAGSLFLGFTVALLAVKLGPSVGAGGFSAVVIPVAVLSVPIFDTTLVTFLRSVAGRSLAAGGRDHSSHRLVALGLPERQAVLVLYGCAATAGAAGLSAFYLDISHANIVVGLFVVGLTFLGVRLGQVRVYSPGEHAGATPVLLDAIHSSSRVFEVLIDVCVITLAYYTAYRLRFNDGQFRHFFPTFARSLPVVVATTVVSLWWTGAYRQHRQVFDALDTRGLLQATVLAMIGSVTAVSYFFRFEGYSRSVFAIAGGVMFLLLLAGRASFGIVGRVTARDGRATRRAVIYGVGDAGVAAVREARAQPVDAYVMGFVDDDPLLEGRTIHGVRVIGGYDRLLELIDTHQIDGIVLSDPTLDAARLAALGAACQNAGVFLLKYRSAFENLLTPTQAAESGTLRWPADQSEVVLGEKR
jgi:UDP-GlcNAc:undecaprenyl-phosphate/decaprenyl-phosphate GlcNAc-1-phosphate transferase